MRNSSLTVRSLVEGRSTDRDVAFLEGSSGGRLTWADLAVAAGEWEQAAGKVGRDRRTGLLISGALDMVGAFLGALSAKVTVAPLDPEAPLTELVGKIRALGLSSLVVDRPSEVSEQAAHECGAALWQWKDGHLVRLAKDSHPAKASAGSAALVLSSSGTTGRPKIIPLTEQQLLHTAGQVVEAHELTTQDRGYSPLPLSHINGLVVAVLSTLITGGSMVVDRRFSASAFWGVVQRNGVTWINLVPGILVALANRPAPAPGVAKGVGFARSASAPLPAAVRDRFESHCGVGVIETYGMTEAASQIAANPRQASRRRPGSVGLPAGLELRVVNRDRAPVPNGAVGQIEIRGGAVVDSYWTEHGAHPASRPATEDDGWLATGDLGKVDPDGFVYLLGRLDDVINRGGEKLYPREIEEVLLRDPDVEDAVVVGRPHPTLGEEPVALVVARAGCPDGDALAHRLQVHCQDVLSRYKWPAEVRVAGSLPSGPTGKVRRAELRRSHGLLASDRG